MGYGFNDLESWIKEKNAILKGFTENKKCGNMKNYYIRIKN